MSHRILYCRTGRSRGERRVESGSASMGQSLLDQGCRSRGFDRGVYLTQGCPRGRRKTGIYVVGDMPWGSHFCLFYETKEDLLDTLISYCKAGLESGEFCLGVVAEPLKVEEATDALTDAVPAFSRYLENASIEIMSARDWYLQGGTFDLNRVAAVGATNSPSHPPEATPS